MAFAFFLRYAVLSLLLVDIYCEEAVFDSHRRSKRNAIQFCDMMECTTSRNCLDYLDHGCWCGPGHKAETVVDDVDECCRTHDNCYGDKDFACLYYVVDYVWACDTLRLKASCANTQPSLCAKRICECDAAFATCLQSKKLDLSKRCPITHITG